jgi:hypothetical protein
MILELWRKSVNKSVLDESDTMKHTKRKSRTKTKKDITVKNWTRNCPRCRKELTYASKYSRDGSEKNNRLCRSCVNSGENNPFYGKSHTEEHKKHIGKLAPTRRPEIREKISIANRGKITSDNTKEKLRNAAKQQYSTEESRKLVSERVYKFYENNPDARIRASEHAKQQHKEYRETDEYKHWESKKSEYELYKIKVLRLTFETDLSKLENWSKRNLYHLYEIDHIYPIRQAFKNSIPAELIGDINNLRIIPRKENRSKSGKITIIPNHIQVFLENSYDILCRCATG